MAVTTQKSTQLTNLDALPPVLEDSADYAGRLRVAYFAATQDGAGDATSSVEVVRLPPGRVTLLGRLSNIEHAWTTASATMDVGWDAYTEPDGTAIAADPNGLDDGIDVDTAGETTIGSVVAAGRKQFDSNTGVSIRLTSEDEILADTNTAEGYLIYIVD